MKRIRKVYNLSIALTVIGVMLFQVNSLYACLDLHVKLRIPINKSVNARMLIAAIVSDIEQVSRIPADSPEISKAASVIGRLESLAMSNKKDFFKNFDAIYKIIEHKFQNEPSIKNEAIGHLRDLKEMLETKPALMVRNSGKGNIWRKSILKDIAIIPVCGVAGCVVPMMLIKTGFFLYNLHDRYSIERLLDAYDPGMIYRLSTNDEKIGLIKRLINIAKYQKYDKEKEAAGILESNIRDISGVILKSGTNDEKVDLIKGLLDIALYSSYPNLEKEVSEILIDNAEMIFILSASDEKIKLLKVLSWITGNFENTDMTLRASRIFMDNVEEVFALCDGSEKIMIIRSLKNIENFLSYYTDPKLEEEALRKRIDMTKTLLYDLKKEKGYIKTFMVTLLSDIVDLLIEDSEKDLFQIYISNVKSYLSDPKNTEEQKQDILKMLLNSKSLYALNIPFSDELFSAIMDIDNSVFKDLSIGLRYGIKKALIANFIKFSHDENKLNALLDTAEDIGGKFSDFIAYAFIQDKSFFSGSIKEKVEKLEKNLKIIFDSLPYEEWLDPDKNPERIISIRSYFSKEDYVDKYNTIWKRLFINAAGKGLISNFNEIEEDGWNKVTFKVKDVTYKWYAKRINTETYEKGIFEYINDPETHIITFNGHAEMSTYAIASFENAPDYRPLEAGSKLFQLAACWTINESNRINKYFPNSQLITTMRAGESADGAKILLTVLLDIPDKKDWGGIRKDLGEVSFINKGNYVLPDDREYMKHVDLDGDGIIIDDKEFNITIEELPEEAHFGFKADSNEVSQIPGEKIVEAVNYVNNSFSWSEERKAVSGKLYADGWYSPAENSHELFKIYKDVDERDEIIYKVKINTGYSHVKKEILTLKLMYELNEYFAREEHYKYNIEDKVLGLQLCVEFMDYYHQEGLFKSFIDYYSLPDNVDFNLINTSRKRAHPTSEEAKKQPEAEGALRGLLEGISGHRSDI